MSTEHVNWSALDFHVGDRMKKSLDAADLTVQQMADYLEVNRNTVGAWINMRNPPGKQTMRLWAMRTGVPLVWLETGQAPADNPPGPGLSYTARDSNPEPSD